ncbi:MAG: class I SAM-dependent methyltransferase [Candidatus Omnitrophica bacterium]|nr:class I SAM-dependent methyltransferase [Candidatus Omnitrophota bacterium]
MSDCRKKLFDAYHEAVYKQSNSLTQEQFEWACGTFEHEWGGFIPETKDAVILDFGCGVGDFLYYLKKNGYTNFYGIDTSAGQIEYCRLKVSDKAQVIDGREFLKDKAGIYDFIMVKDVLEHIPKNEVIELLGLLHQALKAHGKLVIRVPNMSNPFGLDARFNDFTHETGFTSKSLNQVLITAGFTDVQILPDQKMVIRSFKNWIRSILVWKLRHLIRFCYYIQDYTVPNNLDKNIVAVSIKS